MVLFLMDFMDSLYILNTNPLASYRDCMCALHSASLFSLLLMSFDDQKFFILMPTNSSTFPFIVSAFGVFFKKKMYGYPKVIRLFCYLADEVLFCLNLHI